MKTILKVLIILCIIIQSYGQEIVPIENQISHIDYSREGKPYYKDVNGVFNKFLGIWRYQTATELFEITFTKKTNYRSGMGHYEDFLISRYKYVKNGKVIYDTYPLLQPAGKSPSRYISGNTIKKNDLNKIKLMYNEPDEVGYYGQRLILQYLPRTQKLDWYVDTDLIEDPDHPGEYISPYIIPFKMTLTKVN